MIKHCNQCGNPVAYRIPEGDNLPRALCPACGHIQYENPRLIVGCVAEHAERILLCKRAIEPAYGLWTLPAGFMENGETALAGAVRETVEEAGAHVTDLAPFALVNIAHINQVHLFYRGHLPTGEHAAGEESLEVRLFEIPDIPWEMLAFRSVRYCLERYLADRQSGRFGFHETHLPPTPLF